jgi:hypothetical protein
LVITNNSFELNGTHHLLIYASGENVNIVGKTTEASLHAGKEVGVEENVESKNCTFISRHQTARHII